MNTHILQVVNVGILLATLPASVWLLLNLIQDGHFHENNFVRRILIMIFACISVASFLSLILYYQQLVENKTANEVLYLANIRNFIKNISFFVTSWGFYYIEKNSRG